MTVLPAPTVTEMPTADPGQRLPSRDAMLVARGVCKRFLGGDGNALEVLRGVDLTVGAGEIVAVVGASGSGKSTLLHLLGALEGADAGAVEIAGESVAAARTAGQLDELRNRRIGFVFQFHHLLKEFSAVENVAMPLRIGGLSRTEAMARATRLLERVGLGARISHRPAELSGGEQQRVAVARALVHRPALLLADEPTGNLDHHTAEDIHDLIVSVIRESSVAAVLVTHNAALAARADRVLTLVDGRLVEPGAGASPAGMGALA